MISPDPPMRSLLMREISILNFCSIGLLSSSCLSFIKAFENGRNIRAASVIIRRTTSVVVMIDLLRLQS